MSAEQEPGPKYFSGHSFVMNGMKAAPPTNSDATEAVFYPTIAVQSFGLKALSRKKTVCRQMQKSWLNAVCLKAKIWSQSHSFPFQQTVGRRTKKL